MIGNVEALKVLYKKLGGSLTDTYSDIAGGIPVGDYDLIADCILACAKKGSGSGSDLPTPGTAGNVLTSTGDGWESAAIPANEYPVVFTFDGATVTCDKSIANIKSAIAAGKTVKGYGAGDWASAVFDLSVSVPGNDEYSMFVFTALFNSDETEVGHAISVYCTAVSGAEDDFKYYLVNYSELPATTGNNGKVLGVDNGAYALVSPSALSNAPYIVHITQTGTTFATTETCAQIAAAFEAGKAIQARYHFEVSEGEPLVADVNATVESFTNVNNGTAYILTVSWHDDSEATKRLYLEMTASNTTDVFSYTP